MTDYTAHMVRCLGDEAINGMILDGKDCFCGECLCCMAKDEKERRKNEKLSKKSRRVKKKVRSKSR